MTIGTHVSRTGRDSAEDCLKNIASAVAFVNQKYGRPATKVSGGKAALENKRLASSGSASSSSEPYRKEAQAASTSRVMDWNDGLGDAYKNFGRSITQPSSEGAEVTEPAAPSTQPRRPEVLHIESGQYRENSGAGYTSPPHLRSSSPISVADVSSNNGRIDMTAIKEVTKYEPLTNEMDASKPGDLGYIPPHMRVPKGSPVKKATTSASGKGKFAGGQPLTGIKGPHLVSATDETPTLKRDVPIKEASNEESAAVRPGLTSTQLDTPAPPTGNKTITSQSTTTAQQSHPKNISVGSGTSASGSVSSSMEAIYEAIATAKKKYGGNVPPHLRAIEETMVKAQASRRRSKDVYASGASTQEIAPEVETASMNPEPRRPQPSTQDESREMQNDSPAEYTRSTPGISAPSQSPDDRSGAAAGQGGRSALPPHMRALKSVATGDELTYPDESHLPPHMRTPPHLLKPVAISTEAAYSDEIYLPPHKRAPHDKLNPVAKNAGEAERVKATSQSEGHAEQKDSKKVGSTYAARTYPHVTINSSPPSSQDYSKDSKPKKVSPSTSLNTPPKPPGPGALSTEFTDTMAGKKINPEKLSSTDVDRVSNDQPRASEVNTKQTALEQRVAKIHAERGPAPARFAKPIELKELRERIDKQDQLPNLSKCLEAGMPQFLRDTPDPVFLGNQYWNDKKKAAEDKKKADAIAKDQRAAARAKSKAEFEATRDSSNSGVGDGVENVTGRPKSRVVDHETFVRLTAPIKKGLLAERIPSSEGSSDRSSPHALTIPNLTKTSGGEHYRYKKPRDWADDSLVSNDNSMCTHGQRKNVGGKRNLFQHNRLFEYNQRATEIFAEDPGFENEIDSYRDQWHQGDPTMVTDDDSAIVDDLSELDYDRHMADATETEVKRWEWFAKPVESLATRSDDEVTVKGDFKPELSNWDGDWNLAGDRDRDCGEYLAEKINRILGWISTVDRNLRKRPMRVDTTSEGFRDGTVPTSGLRRNYIEFPPWTLGLPERPQYDPIDWEEVPTLPPRDDFSKDPVRRRLTSKICIPIANRIMDEEREEEREAAAEAAEAAEKQRRAEAAQRKAKAKRQTMFSPNVQTREEVNPWMPTLNIHIRPARLADMPQCSDLYDAWIESSVQAIEYTTTARPNFNDLFQRIEQEENPLLVAVLNSNTKHKHARRTQSDQDMIVGFTYVQDFGANGTSLRDTTEIQIWVHKRYLHKGVGKNLFDRMCCALDKTYRTHCGTDFRVDNKVDCIFANGGRRPKIKMTINLFWETEKKKEEYQWKHDWLIEQGWYVAGFFVNGAEKFGRPVNWTVMMRECQSGPSNRSKIYPGHDANSPGIFRNE